MERRLSREAKAGLAIGVLIAIGLGAFLLFDRDRPRAADPISGETARARPGPPPLIEPAPPPPPPPPPVAERVVKPPAPEAPPRAAAESGPTPRPAASTQPARMFEVTGRVLDRGNPVAGVEVECSRAESLVTKSDGHFRFEKVPEDSDCVLCIDDPRFRPWRRAFKTPKGRPADPIDARLERLGPTGFFKIVCRDVHGAPKPEAKVTLRPADLEKAPAFGAPLDSSGYAQVEAPVGAYQIAVDAGPSHLETKAWIAERERRSLAFLIAPQGELLGGLDRAWPGLLFLRVERKTEPRVQDVPVKPEPNGGFRVSLASGPVELRVFTLDAASLPQRVEVLGGTSTPVTFALAPGGVRVAGRIFARGGEPIAGAHVRASFGGPIVDTDGGGTFALDGLGAAPIEMLVTAPGFVARHVPVDVAQPPPVELAIELVRAGSLHVTFVGDDNRPAAGARVGLLEPPISAVTDENGSARLEGIPEGQVEVGVVECGTRPAETHPVQIRGGMTEAIRLRRPR